MVNENRQSQERAAEGALSPAQFPGQQRLFDPGPAVDQPWRATPEEWADRPDVYFHSTIPSGKGWWLEDQIGERAPEYAGQGVRGRARAAGNLHAAVTRRDLEGRNLRVAPARWDPRPSRKP